MLDDFFIRAVVGGVGVALLAGPLGCFIVWRRLAYFGDTLSHSALLGVAMALLLDMNITLTVFIISVAVSLLLILLQRRASLSSDALLGLLAHATLAVGLVVLAFMTWVRVDLMGFLFGDILAITVRDIIIIWCGGLAVIAIVSLIWKSLLASTVSYDIAVAEGLRPDLANFVFMVLMAGVIAISMKIVGVLLITALLIIPAATARRFSGNPEVMAVMASVLGAGSVWLGLEGSLKWDTPSSSWRTCGRTGRAAGAAEAGWARVRGKQRARGRRGARSKGRVWRVYCTNRLRDSKGQPNAVCWDSGAWCIQGLWQHYKIARESRAHHRPPGVPRAQTVKFERAQTI